MESETQSETVAVGLESTQISAEVKKSNSATQLTDFVIIEQYPELPTGCEITAMTMVLELLWIQCGQGDYGTGLYAKRYRQSFYRGEDGQSDGTGSGELFCGDPTEETDISAEPEQSSRRPTPI